METEIETKTEKNKIKKMYSIQFDAAN